MVWPAFTGSGVSVLVTTRSADVSTRVVVVPGLLAEFGSTTPVAAGIDAVPELVSVVLLATSLFTVTTIVIVALPPLAIVPRSAVTVPPAWVTVPWLGVAETNVVPAGRVSVTLTPGASLGPLLVTVTV